MTKNAECASYVVPVPHRNARLPHPTATTLPHSLLQTHEFLHFPPPPVLPMRFSPLCPTALQPSKATTYAKISHHFAPPTSSPPMSPPLRPTEIGISHPSDSEQKHIVQFFQKVFGGVQGQRPCPINPNLKAPIPSPIKKHGNLPKISSSPCKCARNMV